MLLLNFSHLSHIIFLKYGFNTSYVVIKPLDLLKALCTKICFNTSYVVIKRRGSKTNKNA